MARVRAEYEITAKNKTDRAVDSVKRNFRSVDKAAGLVAKSIGAIGLITGGFVTSRYIEEWTSVNNQLLVNIDMNEAFIRSQQDVIDIALDTGSELESVAKLYGRITAAGEELGATQSEIAELTDLAVKAIAVQGSSAGEASGALLQLSQLLGGSVVQAQEFNSLIDGARPLLVAVANGSDRFGGSVAKLREEVKKGTVSSKEFFDAALAGSSVISDKFDKARKKISQGTNNFNTGLIVGIGTIDDFIGSSDGLVKGLTIAAEITIDFARAVTGDLSPTENFSDNMKLIATGSVCCFRSRSRSDCGCISEVGG